MSARDAGIEERHSKNCASRSDQKCNCTPTYQAQVYNPVTRKPVKKTFPRKSEARKWRLEEMYRLSQEQPGAGVLPTVTAVFTMFLAAMKKGTAQSNRDKVYKPNTIDAYEYAFEARLRSPIGALRIDQVTKGLLKRLVDEWLEAGLSASTVRNTITALRACYRWYGERHDNFQHDPFLHLRLPANPDFRFRVLRPQKVEAVISAAALGDRIVWGLAYLAGLRMGEIQALVWAEVDVNGRLISVQYGWDRKKRLKIDVKSDSGVRLVPIQASLVTLLEEHRTYLVEQHGSGALLPENLVVPGTRFTKPFDYTGFLKRGKKAFKAAGVDWRTPHKGRHNYVSYAVKSHIDVRQVASQAGHSSPGFTLARYAQQTEGAEAEAAVRLDEYWEQQRSSENSDGSDSPALLDEGDEATGEAND